MKQTPLAILEDASGKTSVCGVGEKVADQLIVKIEYTRVTLQNGRSTYTLTVKE
jgi:Holliday junction resolvasome RuvABC DNA-binding subunit